MQKGQSVTCFEEQSIYQFERTQACGARGVLSRAGGRRRSNHFTFILLVPCFSRRPPSLQDDGGLCRIGDSFVIWRALQVPCLTLDMYTAITSLYEAREARSGHWFDKLPLTALAPCLCVGVIVTIRLEGSGPAHLGGCCF